MRQLFIESLALFGQIFHRRVVEIWVEIDHTDPNKDETKLIATHLIEM